MEPRSPSTSSPAAYAPLKVSIFPVPICYARGFVEQQRTITPRPGCLGQRQPCRQPAQHCFQTLVHVLQVVPRAPETSKPNIPWLLETSSKRKLVSKAPVLQTTQAECSQFLSTALVCRRAQRQGRSIHSSLQPLVMSQCTLSNEERSAGSMKASDMALSHHKSHSRHPQKWTCGMHQHPGSQSSTSRLSEQKLRLSCMGAKSS